MTDELSWLQQWYLEQCDGEWEHAFGVSIDTIDNPGWSVTICVEGTGLASALFEPVKKAVSENNWVHCHVTERKEWALTRSLPNFRRFEGFGGALNLPTLSEYFEPGLRPNGDAVSIGVKSLTLINPALRGAKAWMRS